MVKGRVSQLILHDGQGGMETVAQALEQGLRDAGWEIGTFILDANGADKISRLRRLTQDQYVQSSDVLLSHSAIPNAYARVACGKRLPVVVVLHSAGNDWKHPKLRVAERSLQRRTAAIVAVSNEKAREYTKYFPRAKRKITVIPNGISLRSAETKRINDIDLLYAARIVRQKRLHILLDAVRILGERGRTPSLAVAGEAQDASYMQDQTDYVDRHALKNVSFLGARDDVTALMSHSRLLVHPSAAEAHSLTLIEAAIMGLPAVISDAVEPTVDVRTIRIPFTLDDSVELASRIDYALQTNGDLRQRAMAIAPSIATDYSTELMVKRYDAVLRSVMTAAHVG